MIPRDVSALKHHFVRWGIRQWVAADQAYKKQIIALTERNSDAVVVDCGCADGGVTLELVQKIQPREVWGIEANEELAATARSRGLRVVSGNLNQPFPVSDAVADVVLSNQVIEHLTNTDLFLTEIWRVLRLGGYAIICTENLAGWHNVASLACGWQPFSLANVSYKRGGIGNPLALHRDQFGNDADATWMQHQRVFAYSGLLELSTLHGFVVEDVRGSGYYPFPGRLAEYLANADLRHAAFLALKLRKSETSAK